MRAFIALALLMSSAVSAHTSKVYNQARRHVGGPRRLSLKLAERAPKSSPLTRRRVTYSKRSPTYKAGLLPAKGLVSRPLDLLGSLKGKRDRQQNGNNQGGQSDKGSGGGKSSWSDPPQVSPPAKSGPAGPAQKTDSGAAHKSQKGANHGSDQGSDQSESNGTATSSANTSSPTSTSSSSSSSGDTSDTSSSESDGDEDSCSTDSSSDSSDSDESDCTESDGDESSASSSTDDSGSTTTASASSASSSSSSKTTGQSYTGEATYYTQNGNAGACGTVSQDSDKVVALYTDIYDNGSNCGRMIEITNESGTTIQAKVMDECPSCTDNSHIDLSTGAFNALGSESAGVLSVTWAFVSS